MSAYFNGFDVVRIDTDGIARTITDAAINVADVAGGSLGTVSVDGFGHVESGTLAADAGVIVEFRHPGYMGRFRRTLATSEEQATADLANMTPVFIVQDLSPSEIVPQSYETWLRNDDNPDAADIFLGYATAGEAGGTTKFPHETAGSSLHYSVHFNPITADGTRKYHRYQDSPSIALFVGSTAPSPGDRTLTLIPLFDHVQDETTSTPSSEESLMLDTLDAGRLAATGDKVIVEYAGNTVSGSFFLHLYFAGVVVFTKNVISNLGDWHLRATIQRVDETTVRVVSQFSLDVHFEPVFAEVTGLDLTATQEIHLAAEDTTPGSTTAKMAHGVFIPGVTDYLAFHGDIVTYLGDPLT